MSKAANNQSGVKSMLVFGDLACPTKEMAWELKKEIKKAGIFDNKNLILGNLEGALVEDDFHDSTRKLYNCNSVIEIFDSPIKTVLSIANNHMYDYPDRILDTVELLKSKGINCVGLNDDNQIIKPLVFNQDDKRYVVFAHCWNVMTKIVQNKQNDLRINSSSYNELVESVKREREADMDSYIVVYPHWNFDYEKLPFPAHRKLSKKLIDVGANAVIGGHSHYVNGGEVYNGGIIIYGLGNFFIPDGVFFNGKLIFPEFSHLTLVVDIKEEIKDSICYWLEVRSDDKVSLRLKKVESFIDGELINKYSPFRKMTDKEYQHFFKCNREKSLLVPIWWSYESSFVNSLKDIFIICRIKTLRLLKTILRKW